MKLVDLDDALGDGALFVEVDEADGAVFVEGDFEFFVGVGHGGHLRWGMGMGGRCVGEKGAWFVLISLLYTNRCSLCYKNKNVCSFFLEKKK